MMDPSRAAYAVLARRIVDAIVANGGRVDGISFHPVANGLCIVARLDGREGAIFVRSGHKADYHECAKTLLLEVQKRIETPWPQDEDLVSLH